MLHATALLDSPPEEVFDRLTRLASEFLEAPVALVSLIDQDRQFFKSQVGLPEPVATGRQTPLSHSFCQHVVSTAAPLIVADARNHPFLRENLAVRDFRVVAYLGVPLKTPNGLALGSLCTMDAKPREWTEREVKILQDLAGSVMTEIELRLLAKKYHTNYVELRQLEMQRDEMVQMLVHDLRNPLTSLMLGLEVVQQTPGLDPLQQKCLSLSRQGGESLLRMVSDILDVSKAEAGRMVLNRDDVSAEKVVDDASAQLQQLAEKGEVTLKRMITPGLSLQADAEKLRRVLVNLMSNAIQHTPRAGTVEVSVRRTADGKGVVFEVADTGLGISREAFGQIFEKFGQTGRIGKISTGLGLPFCKMVVEAHGGSITVESELGEGTVFQFVIPNDPADSHPAEKS